MRNDTINLEKNSIERFLQYDDFSELDDFSFDIYNTFSDEYKSNQLKHYILNLCSQENEETGLFCDNLLKTYIMLQFSWALHERYDPYLNLWTKRLNKSIKRVLENAFE